MLTIGRLAAAAGCKIQTIRYYEEIGLMPRAERSAGNQRPFSEEHLDRVRFIRHGRDLGFSLDEIGELLTLSDEPERSCGEIDAIAQVHLRSVETKITRLRALKRELKHMITQCAGGKVETCNIIKELSARGETAT